MFFVINHCPLAHTLELLPIDRRLSFHASCHLTHDGIDNEIPNPNDVIVERETKITTIKEREVGNALLIESEGLIISENLIMKTI